ncbi:MAG TPA: cyclodeaminase/cyclohydrolase family protein [Tepidisphaeraceae bacterium]|nr:cyclodeaminase/cyclohydrolase family protein [Tepidisphaeraceae bacterium]
MFDQQTTLANFLDAAASRKPTPGGGSVTALVGALAASMGEMTVNFSIGKKGLEAFEPELRPALAELTRARNVLMELMVEDQSAYGAMTAIRKLPETDPQRAAKFNAALLACIRIPEAMAAASVAVLELVDRITGFVNPYLLSDLAVCADLSMATARCAVYNVRAHLPDVKDPSDRATIEGTIRGLLSRAATLIQQVAPRIWERHAMEVARG